MTKHNIQGPWFAHRCYVSDKATFGFTDLGMRIGDTPNFIIDAYNDDAAHLIAAAPDLLSALVDLKALLAAPNKNFTHYRAQCESAIRDAETAIAKAAGRA